MVEQLTFQLDNGGSIPTSPLQCKAHFCEWADIQQIFKENHYKSNHIGGGILHCFRLDFNGNTIGGAVYGQPRHNVYGDDVIDLRRFACTEAAPKNTESYFLAKTIMLLRKNKVMSKILTYADETQGHFGIIYKACNFQKIGEVKPTKFIEWKGQQYHMRSMTIERPYSYALRLAVDNGTAKIITGMKKHIFMYGN